MFEVIDDLIAERNLHLFETVDLPARPEIRAPLPESLATGPAKYLADRIGVGETVWSHQALALSRLQDGANVLIATGTASGKSLIFQLRAFHLMLSDESARVLVFYPQKALAADQYARWVRLIEAAGLPASTIARIDGDMNMGERLGALDRARLVLMTPDACQAWLMRNVASPIIRRFLADLKLFVLDEAHVYESVFGSNVAFLIRRMLAARRRVARGEGDLQLLAATATIAYPREHLCELTGLDFEVVDEDQNGAPSQPRRLYHLNGPEVGEAAEGNLTDLASGLLAINSSQRGRFIGFHDSRQGIERIVRGVDDKRVLPYRSGYEAEDRQHIERAMRDGRLEGVISTSALELGIDIADMAIGLNLGVPQSRKSFRQRVGRIGRARPGAFIVLAPPSAFKRYGESFKSYYETSVEPSYLYLGNRFIQFAHARCYVDEAEALGAERGKLPSGIAWPEGFDAAIRYALPGGGRPREFDFIASLGADSPHLNYPLRQVGEANLDIKFQRDTSDRLGNIAMNQAIREAYPGATYLHYGRAYKVAEWQTRANDRSIRVFQVEKGGAPTKPLLRTTVNASLEQDGVVDGHVLQCDGGLMAEVQLQVTESVEGYRVPGGTHLYKDLRAQNPAMTRKQRDFRTTGVIVRIEDDWFAGGTPAASLARRVVADGLKDLLARDRSIAPQDIDAVSTNIAIVGPNGPQRVTDCIVIYDAVYGGLRLTEDLFVEFQSYTEQLVRAAEMAGDDALVPLEIAQELSAWAESLEEPGAAPIPQASIPTGWMQIYKPGSEMATYHNNSLISVTLGNPQMFPFGDTSMLVYAHQRNGGTQMVMHTALQPVGQDWQWALWNPTSGEIRDIDDPIVLSSDDEAQPSETAPNEAAILRPPRRSRPTE
jgi:DEAD/DEAH box helicase domain-containing protein